jgi:two-component system, response regulator PdtaR
VEDEALVRLLGVGTFADAGFRVIEAIDGDDALGLLEANSDVQLLFTDVSMPGKMNGLALAREVHDRWPHIGIMVVSGQSIPGKHKLPAGSRFLRKPYCPEAAVNHAYEMIRSRRQDVAMGSTTLASTALEKVV